MVPILAALSVCLILVFTAAVLLAVGYSGVKLYRTLTRIDQNLQDLAGSDKSVVVLLGGITKVCESLVASSIKMEESISSFQRNIFPPSGSGREAFTPYTEASADSAWKVESMMRARGVGYEEARLRVDAGAEDGKFFVTE